MDNVMCIDPGLGGTGWAFFPKFHSTEATQKLQMSNYIPGAVPPTKWGVIRGDRKTSWQAQVEDIHVQYTSIVYQCVQSVCGIPHIIIEFPSFWTGSGKSYAAVTGEESSLGKLYYLIGALSTAGPKAIPRLVSPEEWKGQLPKDVVIKRIKRYFPAGTVIKDHEADAIGMGLSLQGAPEFRK